MEVEATTGEAGFQFEGHVDFYGRHPPALGWFVGGWLAHPWPIGYRPEHAVAEFTDALAVEHTHSTFYHRDDVSGRGIGFVFFLASPPEQLDQVARGTLVSMRVACAGIRHDLHPTPDALCLDGDALVEHLRGILTGGEDGSQRREMQEKLLGERPIEATGGFVDFYGYHEAAAGWLGCGWLTTGWRLGQPPERITVSFEEGDVVGEAFAILYPRPDLRGSGEGFAFFVRADAKRLGRLCSVSFEAGGLVATLYTTVQAQRLRDAELLARLRPVLGQAVAGAHRDILLGLLARQPYRGEDTLAALATPIFLEIDEAILAGSDGLVLMGWLLAKPGDIRDARVRCGPLVSTLDLDRCIRLDRPDVIEGLGRHGFDDPRCGFVAFLPGAVAPDSRIYLEVETAQREVGYRPVPRPRLEGIAAIKRLLSAVDVRFAEVRPAFDRVLGPAIEAINQNRLAQPCGTVVAQYGQAPAAPRFSIIVPLYGRLDFVEYQLALFSAHPACADVDFIFVLDDPPKRREAQFLFTSVFERFLIPFKAILLDRNVGFAPANNIGLTQARGEFVVYLNSDVFPGTLDWLQRLADRLTADPSIGVIGPVLLFEDGSVQHRGMAFSRLPEFGGWHFGLHPDKGLRPRGGGLETHISITGACMMLRRALAERVGGFDEAFVIGDFEDSDLCLKLQALGYRCAIDPDIELFHLERKSQAGSAATWRMNLTVYNAWQHERRWGETIAAGQAA